jgi:CHASE2 domain-containing sensor protein
MIPINAEWFRPAESAFKDFDWSDIYFSNIKTANDANPQNQNIIVVNIGEAGRKEIGKTLIKLYDSGAKVIGMDVLFRNTKDSTIDEFLDSAIRLCGKKIVIACFADSTEGNNILGLQPLAVPKLIDDSNLGYVNFLGDENSTVRTFYKVQDFKDMKLSSFSFNAFLKYKNDGDLNVYKDTLRREETIIPYQSLSEHYTTFEYQEILDSDINFKILENKIILLGFTGTNNGFTEIDDKHFTPLNESYAGKALPDMFGVYIHANIIQSYINGYKIRNPPRFLQVFAGILAIFLFLACYMYSEIKEHLWRKAVEISLQLIFGFVIIMLAIYFLSSFGIKWNIGEMIAAVALAEPLVGFYKVIIHYIAKVYNFKSIFLDED